MLKRAVLSLFAVLLAVNLSSWFAPAAMGRRQAPGRKAAIIQLGEKLFRDERFSTPDGDLPASCSHCHLLHEDPQGARAYTDFFNRSWISSRSEDVRRFELRNSPTILDAAEMPRLHYDGEFAGLEDLVKGTLSGRPMGWLPGEETKAFEHARSVLLKDEGEASYRNQLKAAYGVDPDKLGRDEAVDLIAKAVADYCRTLKTRKDSPYDLFIKLNGLDGKPSASENSKDFARRALAGIAALESARGIKFTKGFDQKALDGLKIFLTTDGAGSAGNCVTCHTPPSFSDYSFHNKGISQREYDSVHGEGRFAALSIPGAKDAGRPSARFREIPLKSKPGEADLGFWNFVDLKKSPLRKTGEGDDRFLERMIGTFKTPTLRNLKYSNPYFHDGSLHTVEEALGEIMKLSEMARNGRIRESDEELAGIRIGEADIPALAAFLNSLNEEMKRRE